MLKANGTGAPISSAKPHISRQTAVKLCVSHSQPVERWPGSAADAFHCCRSRAVGGVWLAGRIVAFFT